MIKNTARNWVKVSAMLLCLTVDAYFSMLQAQNMTLAQVDSVTTHLYNNQEWKLLIETGSQAIAKGFESNSIRFRLGVAYYVQEKYEDAVIQFQKAHFYDHYNPLVLEYLYYGYLYIGDEAAALQLGRYMDTELKKRLGVETVKPLDFVYAEGGVKVSSKPDSVSNMNYFHLGLSSRITSSIKIYQGLSFISQTVIRNTYSQQQYYVNAKWYLGNGLTFIPALHLYGMSGTAPTYSVSQTGYGLYAGITKRMGKFRVTPYSAYLTLNQTIANEKTTDHATQFGGVLQVKDNRLNAGVDLALHIQNEVTNLLTAVNIGTKLGQKGYIEVGYYQGNVHLYTENAAYILHNADTIPKQKMSILGNVALTPKLGLYILGRKEQNQQGALKFNYNTFIAGVQITL